MPEAHWFCPALRSALALVFRDKHAASAVFSVVFAQAWGEEDSQMRLSRTENDRCVGPQIKSSGSE